MVWKSYVIGHESFSQTKNRYLMWNMCKYMVCYVVLYCAGPAVLLKMEFALLNDKLADSVVEQCLICLKEEWMKWVILTETINNISLNDLYIAQCHINIWNLDTPSKLKGWKITLSLYWHPIFIQIKTKFSLFSIL